jgi:DNA-binding NtrC family response regulator
MTCFPAGRSFIHTPEASLEVSAQRSGGVFSSLEGMQRFARILSVSAPALSASSAPFKEAKEKVVEHFERAYLAALLEGTQGNVSAAARQAKVDRVHLLKLLRRHGLR